MTPNEIINNGASILDYTKEHPRSNKKIHLTYIKEMSEIKKVEELIEDTLRKNQRDIEMVSNRPLSPEFPYR